MNPGFQGEIRSRRGTRIPLSRRIPAHRERTYVENGQTTVENQSGPLSGGGEGPAKAVAQVDSGWNGSTTAWRLHQVCRWSGEAAEAGRANPLHQRGD